MNRWMVVGAGLLAGACTVGEPRRAENRPPPVLDAGGCDFVVDGAFTVGGDGCEEWADVTPLRGRFGDLYVGVDRDSNLIVLNDWHLRDDAPASAEMYNLFCLGTDIGMFEVRVFGDQHIEAWRDGERIDEQVVGRSGFGPSPLTPKAHTIFEFRLATLPSSVRILECDPAGGRIGTPALPPEVVLAGTSGCFPGSAPEVPHNLVREPNLFDFAIEPGGVSAAYITHAPLLLGTDTMVIEPGGEITIHGAQLGEGGRVLLDGAPAEVSAWTDSSFTLRIPETAGERVTIGVEVGGESSNTIVLRSRCVPACAGGEVCRRGVCQADDLD